MFLLDTDHVGIIQRESEPEYSRLASRVQSHRGEDFYVSITTFHEQVAGWNAYVRRARSSVDVVRAYRMFERILEDFVTMQVLSFGDDEAARYELLRQQRIRIGTMDLRIAATGLTRGFTVLTRNLRDFRKVPGLAVEDWTLP